VARARTATPDLISASDDFDNEASEGSLAVARHHRRVDRRMVGRGSHHSNRDFPNTVGSRHGHLGAAAGRHAGKTHRRLAHACGGGLRVGGLRRGAAGPVDGLGPRRVPHAQSTVPDPATDLSHRLDSNRDPLVWCGGCLAHLSDLHLFRVSDDRADHRGRALHREALSAGCRKFRRVAPENVPARRHSGSAPADHRGHENRSPRK
jgi:hypothetical protein